MSALLSPALKRDLGLVDGRSATSSGPTGETAAAGSSRLLSR